VKLKPTEALPPLQPQAIAASGAFPLASYEVVTAVMAREWLKQNVDNRPLRRAHVVNLKRILERGEYQVTHQGLAFSLSGRLLDGQHRLTALAEMPDDFSIVIAVTRNLAELAFVVIDSTAAKRTYADSLRISKGLAEVARSLATLVAGPGGMSPQFLSSYVEFARPYYEALTKDLTTNRRTWSTATVRTAAIIAIARGISPEYVREIYRCLVTADFNAMPPLVQTMFRSELNGRMKAMEKNEILARCAKIFNPAYGQQTKAHLGEPSATVAEMRDYFLGIIPNARR
jgi:hypothetical protein